ncbi:unnamed protein product [Closterium sp. NIES-65]|nr:unnamed protein product [Closterium sp. NIES-65]
MSLDSPPPHAQWHVASCQSPPTCPRMAPCLGSPGLQPPGLGEDQGEGDGGDGETGEAGEGWLEEGSSSGDRGSEGKGRGGGVWVCENPQYVDLVGVGGGAGGIGGSSGGGGGVQWAEWAGRVHELAGVFVSGEGRVFNSTHVFHANGCHGLTQVFYPFGTRVTIHDTLVNLLVPRGHVAAADVAVSRDRSGATVLQLAPLLLQVAPFLRENPELPLLLGQARLPRLLASASLNATIVAPPAADELFFVRRLIQVIPQVTQVIPVVTEVILYMTQAPEALSVVPSPLFPPQFFCPFSSSLSLSPPQPTQQHCVRLSPSCHSIAPQCHSISPQCHSISPPTSYSQPHRMSCPLFTSLPLSPPPPPAHPAALRPSEPLNVDPTHIRSSFLLEPSTPHPCLSRVINHILFLPPPPPFPQPTQQHCGRLSPSVWTHLRSSFLLHPSSNHLPLLQPDWSLRPAVGGTYQDKRSHPDSSEKEDDSNGIGEESGGRDRVEGEGEEGQEGSVKGVREEGKVVVVAMPRGVQMAEFDWLVGLLRQQFGESNVTVVKRLRWKQGTEGQADEGVGVSGIKADEIVRRGGSEEEWTVRESLKYEWRTPPGKCPLGGLKPFDGAAFCKRAREERGTFNIVFLGDSLTFQMAGSFLNGLLRHVAKPASWAVDEFEPKQCVDWLLGRGGAESGGGGVSEDGSRKPRRAARWRNLRSRDGSTRAITGAANIGDEEVAEGEEEGEEEEGEEGDRGSAPVVVTPHPFCKVYVFHENVCPGVKIHVIRNDHLYIQDPDLASPGDGSSTTSSSNGSATGGSVPFDHMPWHLYDGLVSADVVVVNRGAHYVGGRDFELSVRAAMRLLRRKLPRALLVYRNSPPGHVNCSSYDRPIKIRQDPATLPFHWDTFSSQNDIAREIAEEVKAVYMDVDTMTALRPDGHKGGLVTGEEGAGSEGDEGGEGGAGDEGGEGGAGSGGGEGG